MRELSRRYVVMPLATEAPFDMGDPDAPFVLKPWKDPAALRALQAYRDHCFPELRRELDAWIAAITAGPTLRGGIGRRNEPFAAGRAAPAKSAARAKRGARSARKVARPAAKKPVKKRRR